MNEELKPCPFCGGDAEFDYTEAEDDGMGRCECMSCGVGYFDDRDSAIKQWNKRGNGMEFYKTHGGLCLQKKGGLIVGWVMTTTNGKFVIDVSGKQTKSGRELFDTEGLAKDALIERVKYDHVWEGKYEKL